MTVSNICQCQSSGATLPNAALIPPCADTVCDLVGYTFETTAAPYVHYSVNMSEKVRLYGKAGPVYKFSQSRYGELKNSRSHLEGYAKVGIEYIF